MTFTEIASNIKFSGYMTTKFAEKSRRFANCKINIYIKLQNKSNMSENKTQRKILFVASSGTSAFCLKLELRDLLLSRRLRQWLVGKQHLQHL